MNVPYIDYQINSVKPSPSSVVYVARDDPRYLDPRYWPAPERGRHWADARSEQVAAIRAHEAERRRQQAAPGYSSGAIVTATRPAWVAFPELVPPRPYCTDHLGAVQIRPRAVALRRRYIQLNGPQAYTWLQFDIDRQAAYGVWDDVGLPPPTVAAVNPASTHAHIAYLLGAPVTRFSGSRESPLHYLAAVERGLRRRLDADRAYGGLIMQNPMHADWRVDWPAPYRPYELGQLADALTKTDMRPEPRRERETGLGRNCSVFDDARTWAYRSVLRFRREGGTREGWRERCRQIAGAHNSALALPLPTSDVRSIGKSIADWTWDEFSDAEFSRIQSLRGKRRAAQRWAGHVAESSTRPWEALGISQRTYYRRKAAGRL